MSHQTGIQANDLLRNFFGRSRDGDVRLIKISIDNEELSLDQYRESTGKWEDDYENLVVTCVEEEQPCYLLFRLDTQNTTGYEWALISWSPDNSPVREKMIYASTKATLKKEFGSSQITDELFATTLDDISLSGFLKHRSRDRSPAPLTLAEEEMAMIRKSEYSVDTKCQTIQGLALPISDDTISALFDLSNFQMNYVQMSIDPVNEVINLEARKEVDVHTLPHLIPSNKARYHIFRYDHDYESDYLQSFVFIYTMPGYEVPIKERMLYSSCKGPLVDVVQNKIGIEISKKIEIDNGRDITKEFLREELHPTVNLNTPKFKRPPGPPNRGNRRITKPPSP